jgi:DNA-binding IclR family transcriptional regulator
VQDRTNEAVTGEPAADRPNARPAETLQTLRRGIQILDVLSEVQEGMSVTQLASRLGIHRTIVTRLLSTLQSHRLVVRDAASRFWLGSGLSRYALSVAPRMRDAALPELRELAQRYPITAVLTVADLDEAVILAVVEPARADFFVGIRVGTRHSLDSAAGGIALLAAREPRAEDTPDVRAARRRGYAVSRGKINPGALGVAAPLGVGPETLEGSIGAVTLANLPPSTLGPDIAAAAARVSMTLRSLG